METENIQNNNGMDDRRTSSITLKQTAKKEYYWEIKVYFDKDTESSDYVTQRIDDIDAKLNAKYGGQ